MISVRTLDEWLAFAGQQHAVGIDMGLERVARVAEAMGFTAPDRRPAPRSIIVAGTNGKGSTTLFSESLLLAAGLKVGATISPHVHRFNERIRIDGREADDAMLCAGFEAVESARGETTLTYFEYSALVAFWVFRNAGADVAVLEVGLGGRLDAMNLVGADVAVITSIGLDHEAYLGSDLDGIGREKAGVMRPGRPVVAGTEVTDSVIATAGQLGCALRWMGRDFRVSQTADSWCWSDATQSFDHLAWGDLAPYNCALAIAAVRELRPITSAMVRHALATATLPGRLEAWRLRATLVLVDVAHNPAGAAFLAQLAAVRYPKRRFVVVLGMLNDKDASGVPEALGAMVSAWVCVPTRGPRGQSGAELAGRLRLAASLGLPASMVPQAPSVTVAETVTAGLERALAEAGSVDGVLAFGSFSVVEDVRNVLLQEGAWHLSAAESARGPGLSNASIGGVGR